MIYIYNTIISYTTKYNHHTKKEPVERCIKFYKPHIIVLQHTLRTKKTLLDLKRPLQGGITR